MKNDEKPVRENLYKGEPLTKRETEVFHCLCSGLKYSEIAEKLFISLETVKSHIRMIYLKLNVTSRSNALLKHYNQTTPLNNDFPSLTG